MPVGCALDLNSHFADVGGWVGWLVVGGLVVGGRENIRTEELHRIKMESRDPTSK